jgi:hypothetical protein
MVLIKRVMLAAAMSMLSEGAIAGVLPEPPAEKTPAQQTRAEPARLSAPIFTEAARPETR